MEHNTREVLLQEALSYFKRPCFQRLFQQLYDKCFSLGRLGGTVRINHLRPEESDALEGFLQKDCHNKNNISISVEKIRKALASTKFAALSLEEIVTSYFEGSIVSKKEQKQLIENQFNSWLEGLLLEYEFTPAGAWLKTMYQDHVAPYKNLVMDYGKNQEWLKVNVPLILNAVNQLPIWTKEYQPFPIFAACISGNPHYFDVGEHELLYLMYGICFVTKLEYPKRMNAERRRELLYRGGLLTDDLSNIVLTYGILGTDSHGNFHLGMKDYTLRREVLTLTLYNLTLLRQAYAVGGTVYVVENPMAFYWLMEQQKDSKAQVAMICSAGQPTQAVWMLLDFLKESGTRMYYSGDFDPEGLLIAQRMKERYQDLVKLWHYESEDYKHSMSSIEIEPTSLKKLDKLTQAELLPIGELLKETKLAGYQENILSLMRLER